MTKREAPMSVLKDLCETAAEYWQGMKHVENEPRRNLLLDRIATYRAATAPLRTQAEVSAELYEKAQQYFSRRGFDKLEDSRRYGDLYSLSCEPTSDPSPSGTSGAPATKESSDTAGAPAGATPDHTHVMSPDPADERPCGCEETGGLKRKLTEIETECDLWYNEKKSASAAFAAIGLIIDS